MIPEVGPRPVHVHPFIIYILEEMSSLSNLSSLFSIQKNNMSKNIKTSESKNFGNSKNMKKGRTGWSEIDNQTLESAFRLDRGWTEVGPKAGPKQAGAN